MQQPGINSLAAQALAWLGLAMLYSSCGARPGMDPVYDASGPGSDVALQDATVDIDAEVPGPSCTWAAGYREHAAESPHHE